MVAVVAFIFFVVRADYVSLKSIIFGLRVNPFVL
jgi:hypothetical protein